MNGAMKAALVTTIAIVAGIGAGCGGGGVSGSGTASPVASPSATPLAAATSEGAILYETNCAGCHGILALSAKQGTTVARLQNAITNDSGGMAALSALTATQQQAIVIALAVPATTLPVVTPATPATSTTTPVSDGATLYATYCAGCHGTLASSGKAGATRPVFKRRLTAIWVVWGHLRHSRRPR